MRLGASWRIKNPAKLTNSTPATKTASDNWTPKHRLMAFPASNAQQADVTKKILEDIQNSKKQLLQKGVTSNINSSNSAGLTIPQYIQANSQPQPSQPSDSSINATAKAVWTQAQSQSYGFFVAQDSLFGNSIIPVLPRFDNTPPANSSASSTGTGSQSSTTGGGK